MQNQLPLKNKLGSGKNLKIAPFKKEIRKTTPHKHNSYLELIYLSQGSGFHTIDTRAYAISGPVVYVVCKEQVHHWEIDSEPEGYVLIIKKTFVDDSIDQELKHLLMQVSHFTCTKINDDKFLSQLFALLCERYEIEMKDTSAIIEGLLKALLSAVIEVAQLSTPSKKSSPNLYYAFEEMLTHAKTLRNNVSYYAIELNTTPQNLNAVCRKAVNQPAAEVLSHFIISEAKRLLNYTDNTVSNISRLVGFSDSSHFVKYFKRITGQTPNAYRKS